MPPSNTWASLAQAPGASATTFLEERGCTQVTCETRGTNDDSRGLELLDYLRRSHRIMRSLRLGRAPGPVDSALWPADARAGRRGQFRVTGPCGRLGGADAAASQHFLKLLGIARVIRDGGGGVFERAQYILTQTPFSEYKNTLIRTFGAIFLTHYLYFYESI